MKAAQLIAVAVLMVASGLLMHRALATYVVEKGKPLLELAK